MSLVTLLEDEDDEGAVPVDPAWIESQGRIHPAAIAPYDGKLHSLADGSMVAREWRQTPDRARHPAARCALAIRAEVPEANIVVAAESSPAAAHSVERVIDRGVRVMGQATISATFAEARGRGGRRG